MAVHGRDRRRRLSVTESRELYVRANGRCQKCGKVLPVNWHQSHLVAWTNGGVTSVEDMEAWCAECNLGLGAENVRPVVPVNLRLWQEQALPVALHGLFEDGYVTIHAAPGAGKTILAGTIFEHLRNTGLVDRLVIVTPNRALLEQWKEALGEACRIHVDPTPRDGCFEHPETVGAVLTYQRLSEAGCANANRVRAEQLRTLVVLDEVHHVGDLASWGKGIERFVGSIERDENGDTQLRALVLNMTGTLFRSSGKQRISTVRYRPIEVESERKYEAHADYSVTTVELIGRHLRPIDLFVYGNTIEVVDLNEQTVISSDIADLDARLRSTAIRGTFQDREWLAAFAAHALGLLRQRAEAIEHAEPLKLLFIADDMKSARRATDAINSIARTDFARLVISDEPGALRVLRQAARAPHPLAIVAVRMVTEGFDCPHIATIAYASRITTEMFIAQMMARAMRVTRAERAQGIFLPAAVLIPDIPDLRAAFVSAMVGHMHLLEEPAPPPDEPDERGWPVEPRMPVFEFVSATAPLLDAVILPAEDEELSPPELDEATAEVDALHIPRIYAPRVAVIIRRRGLGPVLRRYSQDESPPREREAGPIELNVAGRKGLKQAADWWAINGAGHSEYPTVQIFQAAANKAAGIPSGGRDHASPGQLLLARNWMHVEVRKLCQGKGKRPPQWADA